MVEGAASASKEDMGNPELAHVPRGRRERGPRWSGCGLYHADGWWEVVVLPITRDHESWGDAGHLTSYFTVYRVSEAEVEATSLCKADHARLLSQPMFPLT